MKRVVAFIPPELLEEVRVRLRKLGLPEPEVTEVTEAETPNGPQVADLVVRVWKAERQGEG